MYFARKYDVYDCTLYLITTLNCASLGVNISCLCTTFLSAHSQRSYGAAVVTSLPCALKSPGVFRDYPCLLPTPRHKLVWGSGFEKFPSEPSASRVLPRLRTCDFQGRLLCTTPCQGCSRGQTTLGKTTHNRLMKYLVATTKASSRGVGLYSNPDAAFVYLHRRSLRHK